MKVVCVSGPASDARMRVAVDLTRRLMASGQKAALIKEGPPGGGAMGDAASEMDGLQLPRVALWSFHQSVCFLGGTSVNDLISFLGADWVVLEGFHESDFTKVVVLPMESDPEMWVDELTFLALGDSAMLNDLPQGVEIMDPDDFGNIAATVMKRTPPKLPNLNECGHCGLSCREVTRLMLTGQGDISLCATLAPEKTVITVGGDPVPMKPFVEDAFVGVIQGFLKSLKGVDTNRQIKITINMESQH